MEFTGVLCPCMCCIPTILSLAEDQRLVDFKEPLLNAAVNVIGCSSRAEQVIVLFHEPFVVD